MELKTLNSFVMLFLLVVETSLEKAQKGPGQVCRATGPLAAYASDWLPSCGASALVPVPRGPAPWFPGDWHIYTPGASALGFRRDPDFFPQLLP